MAAIVVISAQMIVLVLCGESAIGYQPDIRLHRLHLLSMCYFLVKICVALYHLDNH